VFHNRLLKRIVKCAMNHKTRRVVDEQNQVHLFFLSAWPNRQVRPVFDIRLPKRIAISLLKPPGGDPLAAVHSHLPSAVSAIYQMHLQSATLDLARLYFAFPFQDLNDLIDTSTRNFSTKQYSFIQ